MRDRPHIISITHICDHACFCISCSMPGTTIGHLAAIQYDHLAPIQNERGSWSRWHLPLCTDWVCAWPLQCILVDQALMSAAYGTWLCTAAAQSTQDYEVAVTYHDAWLPGLLLLALKLVLCTNLHVCAEDEHCLWMVLSYQSQVCLISHRSGRSAADVQAYCFSPSGLVACARQPEAV